VLDEHPETRLDAGLPVERLPDVTEEHARAVAVRLAPLRERLEALDAASLHGEDLLSLLVLRERVRREIELAEHSRFFVPITPYASPLRSVARVFRETPIRSAADASRYLRLMDEYPRFLGGIRRTLERQSAAGIVLPKAEIAAVAPFLASGAREGRESPFFAGPDRLSSLPPAEADAFAKEVLERISEKVNPAVRDLSTWVAGTYAAKATEAVGLSQ